MSEHADITDSTVYSDSTPQAEDSTSDTPLTDESPTLDVTDDTNAGDSGSESNALGVEPPEGRGITSGAVETGDIVGDHATVIGYLEQNFEQNSVGELSGSQIVRISKEHFFPYKAEEIRDVSERILVEPDGVRSFFEILSERRILVITGEAEVGKGKIAQYLAAQLFEQFPLEEVLLCRSPEQDVRIEFQRIFGKDWTRERVFLIQDAFNRNTDLIRFAENSDVLPLESCKNHLLKSGSFLILTSDNERTPRNSGALSGLRVQVETPPAELALQFLKREVTGLASERTGKENMEDFLAVQGEIVVEKLRTIPRIQQFIQGWLVLVLEREISLEEALEKAGSLEPWLLGDRARDLGTLSAILALVLSHAHPTIESINWFQFNRLRREIDRHLRYELRRGREPRELDEFLGERDILQRIEAEVAPAGGEGDLIRFKKTSYAERLWDCLLGPGRTLLALLVPLLDRLTTAHEYFLRNMAARALGRIGQIDPYGLVYPRIGKWARSQARNQFEALGPLMFGVLSSHRADYESRCLDRCRQVIQSPDFNEARSGILALRDVGTVDLKLAMSELRRVIEFRLIPPFENLAKGERRYRYLEAEIQKLLGRADVRLAVNGEMLDKQVYDLLYKLKIFSPGKELQILFAIQYTLVGLCFELGTARILREMCSWMPPGKAKLAPFLAFLFLRPWGMAHVLERFPVRVVEEGADRQETWSPILYWSFREEDKMRLLSDFLLEIYLGFACLPDPLDRIWRRRFFDLLKGWARQACKGDECRSALVVLLHRLLEAPDRELQDEMFEFLQRDPDMTERGSKLESLSAEVLTANPSAALSPSK